MGAFNQWAKGSFLESPPNRRTVTVALNLLFGAAVAIRANWLRAQGIALSGGAATIRPMAPAEIQKRVDPSS
jgi:hypothetical protein